MHKCAKRFGPRNFGRQTNECTLKSCHNKTSIKYFFCSQLPFGIAAATVPLLLTDLFHFAFLALIRLVTTHEFFFPTTVQMIKTFSSVPFFDANAKHARFEILVLFSFKTVICFQTNGICCFCQRDQKTIDFSFISKKKKSFISHFVTIRYKSIRLKFPKIF